MVAQLNMSQFVSDGETLLVFFVQRVDANHRLAALPDQQARQGSLVGNAAHRYPPSFDNLLDGYWWFAKLHKREQALNGFLQAFMVQFPHFIPSNISSPLHCSSSLFLFTVILSAAKNLCRRGRFFAALRMTASMLQHVSTRLSASTL